MLAPGLWRGWSAAVTWPASSAIAAVLIVVHYVVWSRRIEPATLGSSGAECVGRGAWWRAATSPVVHQGLLHLALNVATVWTLRPLEAHLGAPLYLRLTVVLAVGAPTAGGARRGPPAALAASRLTRPWPPQCARCCIWASCIACATAASGRCGRK